MSRITQTIEAISVVKDLTMPELLELLQALNEKTKASQDFSGKDEREFFCAGMFDDQITDTRHYMSLRNEAADRQAEDDERDPRFAYEGDNTYADKEFA
jgi:hypothetical protein